MSAKKKVKCHATATQTPLGEFDRSILFSCFRPWVECIRLMRETDPTKAADAFLVLADYCLFAAEPDPETNPWGETWPAIKSAADSSIKNRSRRFGTKDMDKRNKVALCILEHPEFTQREVKDATECSLGLVNDVAKTLRAARASGDCSINYNIYSYPRVSVLEQNTSEEEPPKWEEVLGPHQPDAQTVKAVPVHPAIAQERGEAY